MEAYGGEGSPRDDGSSPNPVSAALRHKYRPGAWRYNARVACVLVPSTLMVVFSGGNAMVGTALTGTALVYVFDLLGSAEAALAAVWVTAFALYVATMANGDVFASHRSAATSALLLLAHAQLLFTASAWATLQFRWVQTSFPGVTLACERFLFLVAPLIAGQVLGGWGAAAFFGARAAPWAQLAVQTVCFAAFSLPAESSFRVPRRRHKNNAFRRSTHSSTRERDATEEVGTKEAEADRLILRDVDARTHAALFCAAPFLSYAATHKNTLFFSSFSPSYASGALLFEHACSSALLLAFPPALMSFAANRGGLRWAFAGGDEKKPPKEERAKKDSAKVDAAESVRLGEFGRRARESPPTRNTQTVGAAYASSARKRQRRLATIVVSSLSLAVFAFGALGRVIASGFREYVVLPSPYGYLAVAAAAYGGMLACASFLTGAVPLPVTAATLCVSAVAAAAAIGVPTWLWPAAAASAWGLTRFVADDARGDVFVASSKATDYALFVCGAVACAARFLEDNFGALDVELDEMPIRDLTRFLLLNVAACLAAPGAALTSFSATTGREKREKRISPKAFGAALGLHALMFARCEDALHSSIHEDGTSMYPPYLVAATTVLGTVATEALRSRGAVTELTAWFCKCVYVAKLFVLFVPGEDALVPCVLVALAFTSASHGGAGGRFSADGGRKARDEKREENNVFEDKRRVAAEDLARVFFIFFSLVHARFVAFDVAFALTGRRPTDATVFGGLVLGAACGLTPLVAKRHAHNAAAKRALAVAFASGAALAILKPPMPWKGEADGFWYDLEHVPDFEPDDADVYGDRALGIGSSRRNGWPTWALACAALAAAYCATSKGAGDVVGGAGWAPLGSLMRAAGVDVLLRGVFAAEARRASFPTRRPKTKTKTTFASLFSLGQKSARGRAVAFAAACVAFLETATLRSGVALAGGYAFGAYLGAETFPGAGRSLTRPLCLACAACAWLLAHIASPETNARAAGPAARLAFGVGALCVIAAGWSQRDAGILSTDPKNISFAEARDERLRREEARLGVLGVAVGLAAMVAFALKAAGGGAGGDARARARGSPAATGRARGGASPDDDDGIDDSDADSDSDSDSYSDSGDDSGSRRRLRRRRVARRFRGEDPPDDTNERAHAHANANENKNKNKNKNVFVFGESGQKQKRSPFAPFSGRRPAHTRGVDAELRRRALSSRRAEWIPSLGNVASACSFLAGSALAARVATDADAATFVVAPALLMLHEDGVLFPSLRGARRYAPPLAVVATQLLGAATSDALALGFGAPESELRAAATAAWGGGETFSSYQKWRAFLCEMILALTAAPCAWRLTEYLWSPARRARAAETAALAPLNVLTLAAARSRAAKTLAVTSLLCAAAQHVAQRSAKRAGMRAL